MLTHSSQFSLSAIYICGHVDVWGVGLWSDVEPLNMLNEQIADKQIIKNGNY